MTSRPTPRPALRKAPDSDVHPAEPRAGVVPLHGSTSDTQRSHPRRRATDRLPAAEPAEPAEPNEVTVPTEATVPDGAAVPDESTGGEAPAAPGPAGAPTPRRRVGDVLRRAAGGGRTAPDAPAVERDLRRRKGSTTSDSLRGASRDKLVDADVRVPKSLRKRLRQEAKRRRISPDELVTLLLRDYLDS